MELTQEQIDIINSTGNIKINAVAGSGKTTTVIEYARTRPQSSKILYLVFNKSVKTEAIQKFASKGLHNVTVETAHSLAFRHIVIQNNYKLKPKGYKTNEIAELLNLKANGEKHAEYIIANHIGKFITYFCNSDKQKVQELNYLDVVSDKIAKTFVKTFYEYILRHTRELLAKMDKGEIEITHDFYLKKFQLSNPKLDFDYILFDEGQDASPAMLDIFFKQNATKVIVGDTHQQIYGWRHAINSLEKTDYVTFNLSSSFRFNQNVAELSKKILAFKEHLFDFDEVNIIGKGNCQETKTKAILARTNLGLLIKAIEYISEKKNLGNIYFEGNINSYTYADEGASLYDVLNLYNKKLFLIKDKLIKAMNSLDDLEEYIEKTEDVQLGMMVEIVREYGNRIPGILKQLKEKHVEKDEKEKAEMIFSTVHRSKGMEYDTVQIVNDFITEEKIKRVVEEFKMNDLIMAKMNEEINLLYVAVTRTKNSIHIPSKLVPSNFPDFPNIHLQIDVEKVKTESKSVSEYHKSNETEERTFKIEDVRLKYKDAYKPWTEELDNELTIMYCEGLSTKDMAKHFGRTKGSIRSRVKKLELEEIYG